MHELYELKDMLMKELEEYGRKGEMSAGSLEIVDKLAHAVKNLCKIIEADEEYSEAGGSYEGGSYARGGGNRRSYAQGGNRGGGNRYSRESSYARGRNARRDSMGRYSREGGYSRADDMEEMVDSIQGMMQELPPEIQKEAQRFVQKLEQMM